LSALDRQASSLEGNGAASENHEVILSRMKKKTGTKSGYFDYKESWA
jgi:hypothetical protein